ncbi:hypothetical protein EZV73_08065 [Acidaminobacter sp. JC074]|uniref:hypothetical protein n=1 Tax=Acidaminobacter sp. JC074 TaxID=2530199 RepID=UPI001F0E3238|nr:hypothetical protein [Acidaminobacter sp. JC074]MCH4887523.1 hypothetical protein [Acidaminobacter sp. JC074]
MEVKIYGKRNEYPVVGCGCWPKRTMYEMYSEFAGAVNECKLSDAIQFDFLDVNEEKIYDPLILNALDRGFHLPLTVIDGDLRYQNVLPTKQFVKNQCLKLKGNIGL